MKRVKIGVVSQSGLDEHQLLFAALGKSCAVDFYIAHSAQGFDALVFLDAHENEVMAAARQGIRCFAVVQSLVPELRVDPDMVHFSKAPFLSSCLQSQALADPETQLIRALVSKDSDQVVALRGKQCVWLRREAAAGSADFTALSLPKLKTGDYLIEHFNGKCFLRLLPLLHFLREMVLRQGWKPPPLRACLTFDDPSFHWKSYGFIDFQALADHARRHNYHASIATVPLDSWWVRSKTARIFRENQSHLSVLIHGNNHTWLELVTPATRENLIASLAQALRRIDRLESKLGMPVCRVMESPYGTFTGDSFDIMAALRFDGVCVSPDQVLISNQHLALPVEFGVPIVDTYTGGLCVIRRQRLALSWKTESVLTAFMDQPVMLICHHYDAANGMAIMAEFAWLMNRLGPVQWVSPSVMVRSSFHTRCEDSHLRVRAGNRLIQLPIPKGVDFLTVERSWIPDGTQEKIIFTDLSTNLASEHLAGRVSPTFPVSGASTVEIRSPSARAIDYKQIPAPKFQLWPPVRKVLMEVRDQVHPFVGREQR